MQYRKFGKTDLEISALGFGCMRFPVIDGDSSKINKDEATAMLHYAIDNGVNYIDTAYPYHQKMSEPFVGEALKGGYREKVKLATKLPIWLCEEYEDFNKLLDEQLEKLQTDYIDFYLVHALNQNTWKKCKELDVFSFLDRAIKDGKIKYAGFSFHDELDLFKEIVDAYDWTFAQIQLNYMDEDYQAGIEGMKYAADRNLAIVIMEPLKGGKLAKEPNKEIKEIWDKAETSRMPADWALRWVWNHPEVSLLLSGMSTMDQVKENIKTAEDAFVNSLSQKEISLIDDVKDIIKSKTKVDCTSCGYCIPCPEDIAIPNIFSTYNAMYMYDIPEESKDTYQRMTKADKHASKCVECGNCEAQCPQNLPIIEHLKEAHKELA
ncbi:aldo/keto reductase [Sporosalibacterium faouarense]|uniref:aldo/keto reductase n=1 Tax=Sporosalibacterium faouarense TaxID=516123 RepID=UPI00192C81AF|nr:aldo/keto reductase [Sporosalibacterium faouarense]